MENRGEQSAGHPQSPVGEERTQRKAFPALLCLSVLLSHFFKALILRLKIRTKQLAGHHTLPGHPSPPVQVPGEEVFFFFHPHSSKHHPPGSLKIKRVKTTSKNSPNTVSEKPNDKDSYHPSEFLDEMLHDLHDTILPDRQNKQR